MPDIVIEDPPGKMEVPLNMNGPVDFLVNTSPAAVNTMVSSGRVVGMGRV